MGYSSYSSDTMRTIETGHKTKTREEVFTSKKLDTSMSPKDLVYREARDSEKNPLTVPVMVFLDVTGSMDTIPEKLVKGKLSTLMETMKSHGVDYPAILFGAIGDHHSDEAPLQVGQFESGAEELNTWLTKAYLEGNGGPFGQESYLSAWLIGARYTSTDHFEKRGCKGFLFTIGDEETWDEISASDLKKMFGNSQMEGVDARTLLQEAQRMYHIFHIHLNERNTHSNIISSWKELLGQNFIQLDDYEAVAETIAATVAVVSGADLKKVTSTFDKHTADVVSTALATISGTAVAVRGKDEKGIVKI